MTAAGPEEDVTEAGKARSTVQEVCLRFLVRACTLLCPFSSVAVVVLCPYSPPRATQQALGVDRATPPPLSPFLFVRPSLVQVEAQANKYFQQIYTSQQSIADIVEMLKQFKNSTNQQEREIFTCMINNLFDEYQFFHKYPDKELKISGLLFGNIIQHQLVVTTTLGVALR